MAQSLRRPLLSVVGLSYSLQCRQFTQISPRWAGLRQPQAVRPAQRAEKSLKVLQKEQIEKGMLPSDIGLLEQTFVLPTTKFSLIFTSPRSFVRLQYQRIKSWIGGFGSLVIFKVSSPRAGKRWYNRSFKMERKKVSPTAIALHKQMYSAFADGDVQKLREICTDGVFDSFRARIGGRKRGERIVWELVKYNKSPRVVSDRMAIIPGTNGSALRQAVVRISSQQKLTRFVGGKQVEGSGEARDVLEYVVIQSKADKWKPEEWRVWGTTKETTLRDVEMWQKREHSEA